VGQRWLSARNGASEPIPNPPDTVQRTLTLPGVLGTAVATSLEATLTHSTLAEISLSLTRSGMQRTLAAQGSLTGQGTTRLRYELDPRMYPSAPGGAWLFTFADHVLDVGTGDVDSASVTTLYRATSPDAMPFPSSFSYTSALQDLGEVAWLGMSTAKLHRAAPQDAIVSLRTGATEAECLAAPWHRVDASGGSAAVPLRFLQYQVELQSPATAAALDSFHLEYFVR
ncbi:MAG TPA: hypothetical protein PKU97_04335, partial [Kofleriaceae bacterium]|nr:hypothetical protein [Kofleriaceae bacterium]